MIALTICLAAFMAQSVRGPLDIPSFRRLPALERMSEVPRYIRYGAALLSDDGRGFVLPRPGFVCYSTETGKQIYGENMVHLVQRGGTRKDGSWRIGEGPIMAATDSQFAHLDRPKYIIGSGNPIAWPSASQFYAFFKLDSERSDWRTGYEFYLAAIDAQKRGQNPSTTLRAPRGVRSPAHVTARPMGIMPCYTVRGKLYFAANVARSAKAQDVRVFSWDGISKSLRSESKFRGYRGPNSVGAFSLFTFDIRSGKALFADFKGRKLRELDCGSGRAIEMSIPTPGPFLQVTYYKDYLLASRSLQMGASQLGLFLLDRARRAWNYLGEYEVIGVSAAQNWLMLRTGDGRILLGQ
jgi:hypothetical protein